MKTLDDNAVNKIMQEFNSIDSERRYLEDIEVEVDGLKYVFNPIEESEWEDDGSGKYFFKNIKIQLVSINNNYETEDLDVYFNQDISRTGSYYTDWYYNYGNIVRIKKIEKIIPQKIIPEHTIIEWQEYK